MFTSRGGGSLPRVADCPEVALGMARCHLPARAGEVLAPWKGS